MTPPNPISGWTSADIQTVIDLHSAGQFSRSEDLYHALRRVDRIYAGLESRCNAVRNYPFALKVPDGAPQRLKDYAASLQGAWSSHVLSEADRAEVVERVVVFGFTICRVQWVYCMGQQVPRLQPWGHSGCWWDVTRRCYIVTDADGRQHDVPPCGDGREWVVFSQGGLRPWLKGAILPLGRLLAYLALTTDQWSRFNDAEGLCVKGLIVPEVKREGAESQKLWDVAGELVGGDTVLLPSGFDLKLITSISRGTAYLTFRELYHILVAGVAIVLLGHSAAQETTGKTGTYGSTAAALEVASSRSIADVSVLSASLAPLLSQWVAVNFDSKLYETPLPLHAYAPCAVWDTKPPEDQAAAADCRAKNASAVKALVDALGAEALVKAGLDLAGVLKLCGMPMREGPGYTAPALPAPSTSEETN